VPETRKAFHDQLDEVQRDLVLLAAKVTDAIPRGTEALLDLDMAAAQAIIDGDDDLDALTIDIEERCFTLMALQQPMAGDMRALVTAIRLASEIERSGDLVVNIAKAARRIYGATIPPAARPAGRHERRGRAPVPAGHRRLRRGRRRPGRALDDIDDRLDGIHAGYIAAIIEREEDLDLQVAVQLALIGRYYERIGDHAVNIGERVRYMVTGGCPSTPARPGWRPGWRAPSPWLRPAAIPVTPRRDERSRGDRRSSWPCRRGDRPRGRARRCGAQWPASTAPVPGPRPAARRGGRRCGHGAVEPGRPGAAVEAVEQAAAAWPSAATRWPRPRAGWPPRSGPSPRAW
jgi:phosphate transport system protein